MTVGAGVGVAGAPFRASAVGAGVTVLWFLVFMAQGKNANIFGFNIGQFIQPAAGCFITFAGFLAAAWGTMQDLDGARQLASEMKKKRITKQRMAELMKTSRAQVDRLLDPDNGSATIESLQRAARIVGRELRMQLV